MLPNLLKGLINPQRFSYNFVKLLYPLSNDIATNTRFYSSKYILKSPYADVNLPSLPIHQYIWENISKWPNHIAIECGWSGKKYTYQQLFEKCQKFGYCLRKLGLKKEDTIALFMPNCPDFAIAYLGALQFGYTVSTVNPRYTKEEVMFQLNDCNAGWIVCHADNLAVVLKVKETLTHLNIICTHHFEGDSPDTSSGVILLEDMVADSVHVPNSLEQVTLDLSDTALIAYSSGTTGLPKGTCLTHSNMVHNIAQSSAPEIDKLVETQGCHQDTIPCVLPFFHLYGNAMILLNGLRKGVKLITLPKFDTRQYLKIMESNKNIMLYVVPPIVFFLGNCTEVKEKHFKGVRELISGAAPCSADDIAKIKDKAKSQVLFAQAYGLTESSPVLTIYTPNGSDQDNTSTVGKLIPNTWAKVLHMSDGKELPPNAKGELCFTGPQIMKGYLNNPTATSNTVDEDGWLHTGDIGYYDEQGFFYITDRIKELIKVKGFQVAPAELEQVIRKYPGVLEAGVVGQACERTGETPVAFVQTVPDAKISEQDVKSFVASQLSKHKHLSSVRFVPSIPKTASGKILRRQLKQLL